MTPRLPDVVAQLANFYGSAPDPFTANAFELILSENVAYLATDEGRAEAMARLRRTVGTTPAEILRATPQGLAEAAELGILPEDSARKLREAAQIAVGEFDGDLTAVLELPVDQAKRSLRRFPGVGEPGAEKILLLCRRHPFLAPDSNALRVLVRLGFCAADRTYSATYAEARKVARAQLPDDVDVLIAARHLVAPSWSTDLPAEHTHVCRMRSSKELRVRFRMTQPAQVALARYSDTPHSACPSWSRAASWSDKFSAVTLKGLDQADHFDLAEWQGERCRPAGLEEDV